MILNTIQNICFIKEEELLIVEEWQHMQADYERENEEEEESESALISESYWKKPHVANLMPFNIKIKSVTLSKLHPISKVKMISGKKKQDCLKQNAVAEVEGTGGKGWTW